MSVAACRRSAWHRVVVVFGPVFLLNSFDLRHVVEPEPMMKQTVFDVLMYLFENFMSDEFNPDSDQASVEEELYEAGFPEAEVDRAFTWLEELGQDPLAADNTIVPSASIRVYNQDEQSRLSHECRGVLHMLEQRGILDPAARERVIDRVMALDSDEITLEQVKWVVLMVLFYHPAENGAHEWMEDMVYGHLSGQLH